MELEFGIVSEGVTDQIILERILAGYLGNSDLLVTRLQPKEDEAGNWDKVFKYCESDDFKAAFQFLDVLIIQIDTDFMLTGEVPEKYQLNILNLPVEEIIQAFRAKFIELIGESFYQVYQDQIIFAISVHEIECWLLPMYFTNQKKKASKFQNCLDTLNTVLPQREGFYIQEKRPRYYEKMAKHFRKKKQILHAAAQNASLKTFVDDIEATCFSH